jgi:hypothetical protein
MKLIGPEPSAQKQVYSGAGVYLEFLWPLWHQSTQRWTVIPEKIWLQFRGDDPLIYKALRHPNAVVIARMNNGSVSIDKMVCQARISA